jgi:predicted HTH transcriptional regulator
MLSSAVVARRTKTISKSTRTLLAEGESERADFKRTPDGISAEDLVSFANTEAGGSILAGVEEQCGPGGEQIGVVRGCDVSDATILQITNKALSCVPAVGIRVHIEGLGKTPFLRVDIPPSQTKPHCTPKGIYCRRDGSRNRPLHPGELLSIFLESESRAFAEKFEAAASRITDDLGELEASLDHSIRSMADQLGWADSKLGDTESTLSAVLA